MNALRPMSLSPCLMSKYTLLVIFGPRAASTDCAQKTAASVTTTKMSDALAKNILGEKKVSAMMGAHAQPFNVNVARERPKTTLK